MPTDKERLDWLTARMGWNDRRGYDFTFRTFWFVATRLTSGGVDYWGRTPRAAIDAAMKAERTRKKEEGR